MISMAAATIIAGLIGAGAGIGGTLLSNQSVSDTNAQNEALMRESWSREDNAVQRRVADLKAAGLSPTLAAGSAAASSGPIQLKPKNYSGIGTSVSDAISAAAAVKSLEQVDLENENLRKQGQLLDKQVDNFGLPDWYTALVNMFGLDELKSWLQGFGSSNVGEHFADGFTDFVNSQFGTNFQFNPGKASYSSPAPSSKPHLPALQNSLKDFAHMEGEQIVFDSRVAAKNWFLSLGGTTSEWYYGVRKFGSPEAFLDDVIANGNKYFK